MIVFFVMLDRSHFSSRNLPKETNDSRGKKRVFVTPLAKEGKQSHREAREVDKPSPCESPI